jgi:hypothetical protein
MNFTALSILPARALLLCLSGAILIVFGGCSEDAPSLREAKAFDAYRVYYAGGEVVGRPITSIFGEAEEKDPGSGAWVFIYGRCENPPKGEGGCAPFQIHNYSTCSRWASRLNQGAPLRPFRGAKARYLPPEYNVEIFTGRTTITIGGDPKMFKAALRQLRDVRQSTPSRLPPPAPGSLSGKLPCQVPALRRRAELRLTTNEVEHQLRVFKDHYAGVNCVARGKDRFRCTATYFNPTPPTKVEFGVEASGKPNQFFATAGCRRIEPEPDTAFACYDLIFSLNKAMAGPPEPLADAEVR